MSATFSDLRARVLSGVAMAAVGAGAVWAGGMVFAALAIGLAGLMGWELHRMMTPEARDGQSEAHGVVAAILVAVFSATLGGWLSLGGLALSAAVIAWRQPRDRLAFGAYLGLILWAAHGLIALRDGFGPGFVLWLICVVVASDVAGYFAGRILGGPRFWPRISPKKTWSGTVAGWLLAAVVGWVFMRQMGLGASVVVLSAVLAFAGQMGDIAESALKRHKGVKDSSDLIPGHGGVLDRFDAMIAVAALAYVMALFNVFAVAVS
ncbi:MAG: phosphatidate cytidylyltransferase [Pararhodobacter sp.]